MIVVLAIDALEYDLVEEFNCGNLKQKFYGKTDISEFSQPRTMVLWSSFMTGQNKEAEIVSHGTKVNWEHKVPLNETFFSKFKNPCVIDLPGFNYDLEQHNKERKLMKTFFSDNSATEVIRKEYNKLALAHHGEIKKRFVSALRDDHDLVIGYFSAIDVIGHLNFGNKALMRILYREMDALTGEIASEHNDFHIIVLSDHGMYAIGAYGDHSSYGFWSTNFKNLAVPKITDFYWLLSKLSSSDLTTK